jgi:hypothetical protein
MNARYLPKSAQRRATARGTLCMGGQQKTGDGGVAERTGALLLRPELRHGQTFPVTTTKRARSVSSGVPRRNRFVVIVASAACVAVVIGLAGVLLAREVPVASSSTVRTSRVVVPAEMPTLRGTSMSPWSLAESDTVKAGAAAAGTAPSFPYVLIEPPRRLDMGGHQVEEEEGLDIVPSAGQVGGPVGATDAPDLSVIAEEATGVVVPAPPVVERGAAAASPVEQPPRAENVKPPQPSSAEDGTPTPTLDPAMLIGRGDVFLQQLDVASARLFYRRAAQEGSAAGALAMAGTFDPITLDRRPIRGVRPDAAAALKWYRKAAELGDTNAKQRTAELIARLQSDAARGDPRAAAILETSGQ